MGSDCQHPGLTAMDIKHVAISAWGEDTEEGRRQASPYQVVLV